MRPNTTATSVFLAAAISLPVLYLAVTATAGPLLQDQTNAPGTTGPAATNLPDGKAVLAQALKAMGGEKAMRAVKSMGTKLSVSSPMGEIPFEIYWADPDRLLIKQTMPGVGTVVVGYDGTIGWRSVPTMGSMPASHELLSDVEVEQVQNQAKTHMMLLDLREDSETIETVDASEIDGKRCYKVRFEDADEPEAPEVFGYFDAESHLLAGLDMIQETPGVPVTTTMRFTDWKMVGKLKFFHKVTMTQPGMETDLTYNEITVDNIDASVFDPPEEVKKLATEANKASSGAGGSSSGNAGR